MKREIAVRQRKRMVNEWCGIKIISFLSLPFHYSSALSLIAQILRFSVVTITDRLFISISFLDFSAAAAFISYFIFTVCKFSAAFSVILTADN